MLNLPTGEVFINEIKTENSIAFTDNPSDNEIKEYFKDWKNATKIIYKRDNTIRVYVRKDYIEE